MDQLVVEHFDGPAEEDLVGTREVDQIRGMDCERRDVELGKAPAEGGSFGRWFGSPPPRRGVVAEDLKRRGADFAGAFGDLEKARPHR